MTDLLTTTIDSAADLLAVLLLLMVTATMPAAVGVEEEGEVVGVVIHLRAAVRDNGDDYYQDAGWSVISCVVVQLRSNGH